MGVMTIEVTQSFGSQLIEKRTREITIAGINLGKRQILQANESTTTTATGNITLTDADTVMQFIDPGGANRTLALPSASVGNHGYFIKNTADAWETISVYTGSTLLCVLHKNEAAWFASNNSTWHLAGKVNRIKDYPFHAIAPTSDCQTGDGKGYYFVIPKALDQCKLVYVRARHITAGASGNPTLIQLHNVDISQDLLSTRLMIDVGETDSINATTAYAINATYQVVSEGHLLRIDIDQLPTTAPKGLILVGGFQEN
jgi:hypothetical protein